MAADESRQSSVRKRVAHAITLMRRHKMPISAAAREAETTDKTVLRYGRPAALKRVSGRWVARAIDRLERSVRLYDPKGSFHVTVGSSTTATRISDYHNAVRWFLETGDDSKLRKFSGGYVVDIEGNRHRFLTDRDAIRRLARAGQLGFESIY